MPKIIKRYRYAKLKTITKISDTNYMDWKWRRKYIGFIGELFILQSEEKFPGQHYLCKCQAKMSKNAHLKCTITERN